jgi:hypothetical protein
MVTAENGRKPWQKGIDRGWETCYNGVILNHRGTEDLVDSSNAEAVPWAADGGCLHSLSKNARAPSRGWRVFCFAQSRPGRRQRERRERRAVLLRERAGSRSLSRAGQGDRAQAEAILVLMKIKIRQGAWTER